MTSACVAEGTEQSRSCNIWCALPPGPQCAHFVRGKKRPRDFIPFPLGGMVRLRWEEGCRGENGSYLFLYVI